MSSLSALWEDRARGCHHYIVKPFETVPVIKGFTNKVELTSPLGIIQKDMIDSPAHVSYMYRNRNIVELELK